MKLFIIVTFLNAGMPSGMNNMYIFSQPSFETQMDCYNYVQVENMQIYGKAAKSYNFKYTPEAIYCLEKKSVEKIMKEYREFLIKKDEEPKISS